MSETFIMLGLSIPYYVDFFAGVVLFKFLIELVDLEEERAKP